MEKHEQGFNLEEAIKRENMKLEDIRAVNNPPVPGVPANISDKKLANFLLACGGVEEARKVIKLYYDIRRNAPEIFSQRDPESKEIQQCLQNQHYFHLPPNKQGCPIVYHYLSNSKSSNYHFNNAVKTYFMTIDSCIYTQGPRPGIIFLFDMRNVGLMHLTRTNIATIRSFFHYLQDCLPAKLHSIHVLNVVSFFNKILALVKPFMNADIFKALHLHSSDIDWDDFYENVIPKSSLPSDYGGDLPSCQELHESHVKEFSKLRDYFLADEEQVKGTIESSDSE